MKIERTEVVTYDITNLYVNIPVKKVHFEDLNDTEFRKALESMVITWRPNFSKDSLFNKTNIDKDVLFFDIEVDTGLVLNWPDRVSGEVYIKAVDEGLYQYMVVTNTISEPLIEYSGYVPSELQISDNGYGDYICFVIDEEGYIKDWEHARKNIQDTINSLNDTEE